MLLTEQNVQQVILKGSQDKAVFVYFFADAPECQAATKAVKAAIPEGSPYITLAEADVGGAVGQAIAMQLGLRAVPAIIVFSKGQPVDALQGDEVATGLQGLITKYMPSQCEILLSEAADLEKKGDLQGAMAKASEALKADPKSTAAKFRLASLCIRTRNLERARELLSGCGRTETESQDYKDLMSALTIAEQAADSPELRKLREDHEKNPGDKGITIKYAAALSSSGKHRDALEMLFALLKQNSADPDVKKTFIDILNTLGGDPLQKEFRRKLYALMY
ncbi:MAG: tetratricopeptide repeat protein [Succinivibrio sp.]